MENSGEPIQLNLKTPSQNDQQLPIPTPDVQKGDLIPRVKKAILTAKEKVFPLAKCRDLKVKQYSGELNQEEFDELLSHDFQEQLRDTPPIEGVFSPEDELAKIKNLPKEQRGEALTTFKEKLARQSEGLAACRLFIERSIEFNNDVPKEKIAELVEIFGTQYGFTEQHKQIANQLIDGYYANRKKVLEIRSHFQDDSALVSELTGISFDKTSTLTAEANQMSIVIFADKFDAARIYKHSKHAVVSPLSFFGFAAQSLHKDPIFYIVIDKDRASKLTPSHEHEHQKNRLLRKIFDKQDDQPDYLMTVECDSEQDPELKRELLEKYFHIRRQYAFQNAKDEILAMKKDRRLYSYDIFFRKDQSPHDYLANIRDDDSKKSDTLWQETAKSMLVDEYRKTVEDAVAAFDQLETKGNYTREEIIAMLADKSLPKWPKTARRLLEQKEKS